MFGLMDGTRASRSVRFGLVASVASAALFAELNAASAQNAVTLDEISVAGAQPTFGTTGVVATRSTAGMRGNISIVETPATVSVITREELDIRGAQDINTATAYTPGIYATDYPGGQGAPAFTLRGFRTINFENVYEDGLRYGFNTYDQNIEPYGYERIDVIKGPVSALFGSGQPGGIINMISKRPQFTPSNEVFLQGGSYGRVQGGFDLTGPVVGAPDFAYRFTGLVRKADSQVDYTPDDRIYLAPAITWKPDADTSLTILAKYQQYGRGGSEQVLPIIGSIIPSSTGFFKRDLFIGHPTYNSEAIESRSVGYVLDHSFAPGWLFHSAFRYTSSQSNFRLTGFDGFYPQISDQFILTYPYKRNQASQALVADNHVEGRFDTGFIQHNIVAGIDYQYSIRRNQQFLGPDSVFNLYTPNYQNYVDPSTLTDALFVRQNGTQVGFYLQDQMKIGNFILTGSVRNDKFAGGTLTYSTYVPPVNMLFPSRQNFSALSYRGAIGYEFDNGIVPYVSYSTSFNPQISGLQRTATGVAPLDPNEGKQIEGGLKYQPPGINALFTASGFQITQTNVPAPDPTVGNAGFLVQTGEAVVTGFELEGKATFENGLTLIAGFAHLKSEVTKDTRPNLVGNKLPNVPENTLSVFVDYAFPSWSYLDGMRAGAGVRYVGDRTDITNADHLPAYALVDASISYDLSKLDPSLRGFTASANALNLFDQRYFTSAFYQGTVFEGYRRTAYGQITYRW